MTNPTILGTGDMTLRVLSLFDGMSCAQLALKKLDLNTTYYASEINKYSTAVTQYNFPNTVQVGDVTRLRGKDLGCIDLLIGGSPCQGFSRAGKNRHFEDERSGLVREYVRILKEVKPRRFILENTDMRQDSQDQISQMVGVEPILINSNLVSAQNRRRLYWTNIPVTLPEDRSITLSHIIESRPSEEKRFDPDQIPNHKEIVPALCFACRGRPNGQGYVQRVEIRFDGKSNALTTAQKDNYLLLNRMRWRHFSCVEYERLQTVPDNYTAVGTFGGAERKISDHQRRVMVGNGFTVDVIAHILSHANLC